MYTFEFVFLGYVCHGSCVNFVRAIRIKILKKYPGIPSGMAGPS